MQMEIGISEVGLGGGVVHIWIPLIIPLGQHGTRTEDRIRIHMSTMGGSVPSTLAGGQTARDGDPGSVVGLEFPSQPLLGDSVVDFEVWATCLPLARRRAPAAGGAVARRQSRVKRVLLGCSGLLLTLLTTTRQAGAYIAYILTTRRIPLSGCRPSPAS